MITSVRAAAAVLVGVDGSSGSDEAVRWASTYAAAHRRPLMLVHGAGAPVVTDFAIDLPAARHDLRLLGHRVTDHALEIARAVEPTLVVDCRVEPCEPRSLLIEAAADAHLLVVGSRGHGAVMSLLLGSVSVAVTAHAPCPVVVVRPIGDEGGLRPVVVGIDATSISSEPPAGCGEKFPDVTFTTHVRRGTDVSVLVGAAEHASTVVVGARGARGATTTSLGSVSRSVVEQARCTVAVVGEVQA